MAILEILLWNIQGGRNYNTKKQKRKQFSMPRRNLKNTSFTNIVWKCPIAMSNYWMAKQQVQSQANHFKDYIWNVSSFSTGDCMPRRNLRQVGWWRLSTFNNLLSEKCPIIMKNLLNGNFRKICIVVKHSRWKKRQNKKAEAEIVFNATKKFEE